VSYETSWPTYTTVDSLRISERPWDLSAPERTRVVGGRGGVLVYSLAPGPPGGYSVFTVSKRLGPGARHDLYIARSESLVAMRPFLNSSAEEYGAAVSPNGHLVAYVSTETGKAEVYVRPLPGPGAPTLVSLGGASEPVWSRDGQTLFYRATAKPAMSAARIATNPALAVTSRVSLFPDVYLSGRGRSNYDVMPNGDFLMLRSPAAPSSKLLVAVNWERVFRGNSVGH
jgi:hypothetical protein